MFDTVMSTPTKETRYFLRFLRKYTFVILGVCAMSPVIGYLGKYTISDERKKKLKFVIALFL